jgi:DNA-binding NarL/FixJ family response regulator
VIFKILIVDDSVVIRRLVRLCIQSNTDWHVCGEAENGHVAVEKVSELKPHVVILDLSMPVMDGIEAARHIARITPEVTMVLFTMHNSEQLKRDARTVGIQHVISKLDTLEEHLLTTLKTIYAGIDDQQTDNSLTPASMEED